MSVCEPGASTYSPPGLARQAEQDGDNQAHGHAPVTAGACHPCGDDDEKRRRRGEQGQDSEQQPWIDRRPPVFAG